MASIASSTPEGLFDGLAGRLTPFTLGAAAPDDGGYLAYYGLDFKDRYPNRQYSIGQINSGRFRLAVQSWHAREACATLYLVHGLFDHVGLYSHLIQLGLEQGMNVVAFDLPGHGLSSGPRAEIDDFEHYRAAIVDVVEATSMLPGPRHVIAQSTGGAAVMDYLQCGGDAFSGVVLLAPLIWPKGWRRVRLAHAVLRHFVAGVPRGFAENSHDQAFLSFLRADPLQPQAISVVWISALAEWLKRFLAREPCPTPLLVMQGDDDTTVDWRRNLPQLQHSFPNARIETLPAGRHHLANEHPPIREPMAAAIADYLAATAAA